MAASFISTGSYSNLTRLELEQLRKADFFSGGKALTVGDSALPPEGVVGKGNIQAEPYTTQSSTQLDDVYSLTAPSMPGTLIGSQVSVGAPSEVVQWYGPEAITDGVHGTFTDAVHFTDATTNFSLVGVAAGDVLILRGPVDATVSPPNNEYTTAVVTGVAGAVLTLTTVNSPDGGPYVDSKLYGYTIIRPGAVQLFAVPGSGPTGEEQTFLMVLPGSTLHGNPGPTLDQINADRVVGIVPPTLTGTTLRDRADAVYAAPAPRGSGMDLGYRVILYPDNGSGTAPDLTRPITSLNPTIDPAIPAADQRMTIDYKAGTVRFSCAPKIGGDIKVGGGVGPTGRLNLYAVFFAFDQTLTKGAARHLWESRSDAQRISTPARVYYNRTTYAGWRITENADGRDFFVQAPDTDTDYRRLVRFGVIDPLAMDGRRYFTYDPELLLWRFVSQDVANTNDRVATVERAVADKTMTTVGDGTSPPMSPADLMPWGSFRGRRYSDSTIGAYLGLNISRGDYGVVHLRRGKHTISDTLVVPPGVILEGEGDSTVIEFLGLNSPGSTAAKPAIKFGPNTPWGVYDPTYDGSRVYPSQIDVAAVHIEGYQVVWNSVRRVWGVFWADATSRAIWFNEVGLDGNFLLPAHVDLKSSPALLCTTQDPLGRYHTTGHYPRVAFDEENDVYCVTWVQQVTLGGVVGPQVWFGAFQVEVDQQNERVTPFIPTVTVVLAPAAFEAAAFSDHPSVATTSNPSATLKYAVCYWRYAVAGSAATDVPTSTSIVMQTAPGNFTWGTSTHILTAPAVVTSTDVAADGWGGFEFVWSRHTHPLIMGTNGVIARPSGVAASITARTVGVSMTLTGLSGILPSYVGRKLIVSNTASGSNTGEFEILTYVSSSSVIVANKNAAAPPDGNNGSIHWEVDIGAFTDASFPDFNIYLGPQAGRRSKFLRLGKAFPTTYLSLSDFFNQDKADIYGNDYMVQPTNTSTVLELRSLRDGYAPAARTNILLVISGTGVSTGVNTITDAAVNFTTAGIQIGDQVFVNGSVNQITGVAAHQLTLADTVAASGALNYFVFVGAHHEHWAISPQTCIEGVRWWPSGVVDANVVPIAGWGSPSADTDVVLSEYEPDFVRITRGSNGFLVVYQAMRTTAQLAYPLAYNFAESAASMFASLRVNDYFAPYREHIGTNYAILNDGGQLTGPSPVQTTISYSGTLYQRMLRATEVSNRSLGTRGPMVDRPNLYGLDRNDVFPVSWNRSGNTFNIEVGCINWMHRWDNSTQVPSLIPDATWTGEDWTVVSPTKRHIHGYTGVYTVDGGGIVTFYDVTMYFGTDTPNTSDGVFQRRTIGVGDAIWFPGSGAVTITSIVDEHTVVLQADVKGLGPGSVAFNCEWALESQTDQALYGIKNAGYRVSEDGRVISSTSYMTFAAEYTDNAGAAGNGPTGQQEILTRTGSATQGMAPSGALAQVYTGYGGLLSPGTIYADSFQMGGRYIADIGWKGVAVGEPLLPTSRHLTEAPMVSIAWGENMFAFLGRDTTTSTSTTNQIKLYRQSFGPYNNGIRNLKIVNKRTTPKAYGALFYEPLSVLSTEWVYTRHGAPSSASARFDTDGFRNVYAYMGAADISYTPAYGHPSRIRYVYTDTLGRDGIHVDGPMALSESALKGSFALGTNPQVPFQSDIAGKWYGVSSPKVVWDGQRFVVAWAEGGGYGSSGGNMICLSVAPGDEDAGFQTTELGDPNDLTNVHQIHAAALTDLHNGSSVTQTTILDVAFSGKKYAVLWVAGLDTQGDGTGTIIGVTIFDQLAPGSHHGSLTFDERPLMGGLSGVTNGTQTYDDNSLVDSNAYFKSTAFEVLPGDILIAGNPGDAAYGVYQIRTVDTNSITVDRSLPAQTGLQYVVKRPLMPAGGKSYVLGSMPIFNQYGTAASVNRLEPYRTPKILWDGKQFVASWVGSAGNLNNYADVQYNGTAYDSMYVLPIPEEGLSSGEQIVQARSPGSNGFLWRPPTSGAPYLREGALGLLNVGSATPDTLYLGVGQILVSGTTGRMSTPGEFLDNTIPGGGVFASHGVQIGDILVLTSTTGANVYGIAVIAKVNGATLYLTDTSLGAAAPASDNQIRYQIFRRGPIPAVRPGDRIKIERIVFTAAGVPGSNTAILPTSGNEKYSGIGTYEVRSVDYRKGTVDVSGVNLPSTAVGALAVHEAPFFFGEITSGATSDSSLTAAMLPGGPMMNGRGIGLSVFANGIGSLKPERIIDFVYNEVDDEYAALWLGTNAGGDPYLNISTFKLSTMEILKTVLVYYGSAGDSIEIAALGWNGSEYLVVYVDPTDFENRVYAIAYTPSLSATRDGTKVTQITNLPSIVTHLPTYYTTDPYNAGLLSNDSVQPRFKQFTIKWNPILSRWVIGVSVAWYWTADASNKETVGSGSDAMKSAYQLAASTITSATEKSIQLSSGTEVNRYIQPGLRLYFSGATNATAIIQKVDYDTRTITLHTLVSIIEQSTGDLTGLPAGSVWVEPREDVFCITLGSPNPTVLFDDADGTFLENVTISGEGTIESKFLRMSRPIWQSGGMMVGNWARFRGVESTDNDIMGVHPAPGHNHRFLEPSAKVNLPRISNVKINGRYRYQGPPIMEAPIRSRNTRKG
jgi:hypothetical protein